ncbi:MAG: ParB/RepB/Spo0J family partition protein [Oscillospiraceae bacterium]|jgi:ParB family chromosome partitioning protein|nr:ParB/RepB/Spo0J family partition protein [Oscillospiraceae bacterium]
MKNTGLGRGLGALLGDAAIRPPENSTVELRISEVEPNSAQPRKGFDESALADLTESIRQQGILMPLLVRRMPSGSYQIIAGERRWRAARAAGLTTVPAIVHDADDRRATELALIENLQREDLNPIEIAEGYKALSEEYGLTQEEISERVGRSRPAIANTMRILSLSKTILDMVRGGRLSEGQARSLLPLSGRKAVEKAALQMADGALTVRQGEMLVKKLLAEPKTAKSKPLRHVGDYERGLTERWGRKVIVSGGVKKGKIEFEYYDARDLEALVTRLMKP